MDTVIHTGNPGDFRVKQLEEAIRENQEAKKNLPDCPCWGNAPQWVDAELYAVLAADVALKKPFEERVADLEKAIRKHHDDKLATPQCTCWITPTEKADARLYAALASGKGTSHEL